MKCLSLDYYGCEHILTMQVNPAGIVSRISLMMDNASNFLPPSDDLPSAQSTAAPIVPDSMLTRLDRLCESLGDTLREVVIALFPRFRDSFEALQANPVKPMRGLRDQMPSMARRRRLVFRMSQKSWQDDEYDDDIYETVCQHVLVRDSPHWGDVMLDNESEDVSTEFGQGPWYVRARFSSLIQNLNCPLADLHPLLHTDKV